MKKEFCFRLYVPFDVIDDTDPVIVDPLDTEAVKKSIDTLSAQKKRWREKAVDPNTGKTFKELYEESVKKNTPPASPDPLPNPGDPPKPVNHPPSSEPSSDWLFDNIDAISSLLPDERTELRQTAKDLNVDPIKFIKSKAGQAQLEAMRAKKKAEGNTPTPSNQVPVFNGRPIKDILTDPKATPDEKQKAYEARLRGGRGVNQAV